MKKYFSLLIISILCFAMSPITVFGQDVDSDSSGIGITVCNDHGHEAEYVSKSEFKKEVVIEVASEEEALSYPRDPNYKYTFIIQSSIASRAVCYICGRPSLGLATTKEQGDKKVRQCPINGWGSDHMDIWCNYEVERCTSCGFSTKIKRLADTYTATCFNGAGEYEVRKGWNMTNGYDIHQSYDYWMYGIFN
ncbi:hypothetical protein [Clostridium sp.]|uniref:hypothetical protein n=1 Tax=Clostridium sp. TaxID=1506 RepID=UPI0034642817